MALSEGVSLKPDRTMDRVVKLLYLGVFIPNKYNTTQKSKTPKLGQSVASGRVSNNYIDMKISIFSDKERLEYAHQLREEYKKGKSLRQIAEEFGTSHSYVWAAVRGKNQGIIRSFQKLTDLINDEQIKEEIKNEILKDIYKKGGVKNG